MALAAAYLAGSIPFGFLLAKLKTGVDVRAAGSGNIGAGNVLRTAGLPAAILTLALDAGKGWFAVWLMERASGGAPEWMCAAVLAVLLGHIFSIFLRFRGGKAVATFFGAWFCLAPLPAAAALLVVAIVAGYSRFLSLGAVVGAGAFPFGLWLIDHPGPVMVLTALAAAILVVFRHLENMRRIRAGSEPALVWAGRRRLYRGNRT
jgi:glycerol-3-phosphate acyltransferase PlsY